MEPRNSREVLETAFTEYADAIFRHCYFRVNNRESAKDLTQQVFTQTWDYLARGHKIDNIKAFLYTVANNLIINFRKKKTAFSLDTLMETDPTIEPADEPQARYEAKVESQDLLERLRRKHPAYAEVLVLRYIDDLSVKDIARLLTETENTISVRIHRALGMLREIQSHQHEK